MKTSKFTRFLTALLAICLLAGLMIPALAAIRVSDYGTFLSCLKVLEGYASSYAASKGGDANALILNYIRTGVEKYTTSSWTTMAGPENTAFVEYVAQQDAANGTTAAYLRDMGVFTTPNGQEVEFDHMFGAMDMAYYNATNADIGSWAGDLTDLVWAAKNGGVSGTLEEMLVIVRNDYLCKDEEGFSGFGIQDIYGDLDAYYLIAQLRAGTKLSTAMEGWYTTSLTDADRAAYFLNNRFKGLETQEDVRNAIYTTYDSNVAVKMLEADNGITAADADLRYACCYSFADYLYELAADRLEGDTGEGGGNEGGEGGGTVEPEKPTDNPYYSVFSSDESTLAPGISQTIKFAYTADNKQLAYYIAAVDISRSDVSIHANYKDNDPSGGWGMDRVYNQMVAAQDRHSNPADPEHYIENYNVTLGVNADFFNMSTGKPSGALVMEGVTYHPANNRNFFAILKDGSAVIGTGAEWATYADQVQEAVGAGDLIVKNGEICTTKYSNYASKRASRTAVGLTADGQVILMVLDGRQEPFSAGGALEEIAQIMLDAGCVIALNLDGGGSSTFVSKAEGSDELSVVNSPSDGYQRNVSSSLVVVSTAVVSNEFDHANISTEYDYLTAGTSLSLNAVGVSPTGHPAQIPENAVWQVSDSAIGSVTDGVFTALSNGTVDVQLVADGTVVGSKTLNVVIPDALNIPDATMNVVYDVPTKLPLEASYQGNPVAFNERDVIVVLQFGNAGTTQGLYFTVQEVSEYRTMIVGAALLANTSIVAMTTVNFYRADETVFDFNNATSGDETFAWIRDITNSESADGQIFHILDTSNGMDLSYTFGLNMEAIAIPEKLMDLTGMLSGNPDDTAWDYLLQLAERVSVLSTVEIKAQFDKNLEVDISELTFSMDLFVMTSATLDPETNELTIVLNWIDQTQALDKTVVNPVCILSGFKAKPKADAVWTNDMLPLISSGTVTYDIYLRASQLYSFSSIPENQQLYGLYPFVNNDVIIGGGPEKGGHFMDTYATFSDAITLDRTNRQGWYSDGVNLMYYVDNEKLTGTHKLPCYENPAVDYIYIFDENGNCSGTASGLIRLEDSLYYAIAGEVKTGWHTVSSAGKINYYYFDPATGAAVDGVQTIDGYTYTFTDHILTRGALVTDANGTRYRWAGAWMSDEWLELDGKIAYVQRGGYFLTGLWKRFYTDGSLRYFAFGEDGWVMSDFSGFYDYNGATYLIENGYVVEYAGLVLIDGDYYYFHSKDTMVKGTSYWVSKNNGYMENGRYTFDADGKMVLETQPEPPVTPDEPDIPDTPETLNGIVKNGDVWYYYVDGVKTYAGLILIDGDYYYVNTKGEVKHDCTYYISKNNGYMPNGSYTFDAEGKLVLDTPIEPPVTPDDPETLNGIVKNGDVWYYYVNGVKTYAGLILIDGDYYYVNTKGEVKHDCTYYISKNNGYMPNGSYTFDAEGKLVLDTPIEPPVTPDDPETLNGIVKDGDTWYYYVNGAKTYAGLILIDGYYYYVDSKCQVKHDCTYWISKNNGYMPNGSYTFDAEGKLVTDDAPVIPDEPDEPEVLNGIVKDGDTWYYYENGVKTYAGLILIDGYYYYVNSKCEVKHDCTYWISKNNGYMPNGSYTFDSEGRMVL